MRKTGVKQQIEYIMDTFDFEKVQRVMEFLNWTWATGKESHEVPTVEQVKECALHLLNIVAANASITTGGFHVECDADGNRRLGFEIEWTEGLMAKYGA